MKKYAPSATGSKALVMESHNLRTRRSASGIIRTEIQSDRRVIEGSKRFRRALFHTPAQLIANLEWRLGTAPTQSPPFLGGLAGSSIWRPVEEDGRSPLAAIDALSVRQRAPKNRLYTFPQHKN